MAPLDFFDCLASELKSVRYRINSNKASELLEKQFNRDSSVKINWMQLERKYISISQSEQRYLGAKLHYLTI